ncbi:Flavonol synthase/flavanone 3-hydroxylase [Platanthera zijinensis]|uniref:Flavonol synthase/flavanone 3-hydroxylase n=1 Tax=Platanthera zijinensis TaxID=2320716 RepID=A0AAP0G638_9ASPA
METGRACSDSGFFYLTDHGISLELVDEVFYESKRFFNLPLHEKMKLLWNKDLRGYTPTLDESLDPQNEVHGEYKEGYYIGSEIPEDDPRAEKYFFGPNQWPSKDILPRWKQVMEQYHKECVEVAQSVAKIIALALDLDPDFFSKPEILGEPIATLRLLHYEGKVSNPSKGIFGCGAHSDYGFLTLLMTDDVVGLQICKDKDARPQVWEYVAPLKGAFVVNLGDMLERWSNNIFRSTLHRVVIDGQERYSFAFFLDPNHDCVVECLPSCTSATNPPKYSPITSATYLIQKIADTHADLSSYDRLQGGEEKI